MNREFYNNKKKSILKKTIMRDTKVLNIYFTIVNLLSSSVAIFIL